MESLHENIEKNFVEIELESSEQTRIIRETLTRMGIGNNKKKKLYQSCHLIERNQRYYIVHFKELFLLDNKNAYFTEGDLERRNRIAQILEEWGLCRLVDRDSIWDSYDEHISRSEIKVFIISYAQKRDEWELIEMYKKIEPESSDSGDENRGNVQQQEHVEMYRGV